MAVDYGINGNVEIDKDGRGRATADYGSGDWGSNPSRRAANLPVSGLELVATRGAGCRTATTSAGTPNTMGPLPATVDGSVPTASQD
jgi:hypothetical protein